MPDEHASLEASASRGGHRLQLPVAPSPVVGRQAEMQAVTKLLASGRRRLVTLTGVGGVGKTRLSLAAAEELAPRFADGAAFISLAPLWDQKLVVPTIARGLGLREAGAQPLRDLLHAYLRSRSVLLVLDNCEHVLGAAPEFAELLAAAPEIVVLATSRSPLGLRAEQMYRVRPLAIGPACRLFADTAQRR
jgi:predicted ATPase